MKTIWKWILGFVIVLVVVAAVGFAVRGFFVPRTVRVEGFESFRNPMDKGFERDGKRVPDFGYDHFRSPMGRFNQHMPMYGYRTFGGRGFGGYGFFPWPFMFFGGLLRLIFPLVVLVAVWYFAYMKGKKDGAAEALASETEPEPVPASKGKTSRTKKDE